MFGIVAGGIHRPEKSKSAMTGDRVLALIDVGRTPVSLTLKPDGGELIVCDFDSDSISIIETGNDEVGSSTLIGQHPSHGVVTRDNSRLYARNFGSDRSRSMTLTLGRRIATMPVGGHPDGLALSQDENYLLVLDTQSGDVTVIQKRTPRKAGADGVFPADHDSGGSAAEWNRGEGVYGRRIG